MNTHPDNSMRNVLATLCTMAVLATTSVGAQEHTTSYASSPFKHGDALPTTSISTVIDPSAPTIVVRYLGFGCTHCVRQLSYLNEHAATLRQHGIRVVAFSEDDAETNAALIRRMGYDASVMQIEADVDDRAARALGAVRVEGDRERDLHASLVVHHGRVLLSVYGDQPYMDIEHLVQTAVRAAGVTMFTELDPDYLKRYLDRPVTATVVAGPDDGIKEPIDLDFNRGVLHRNDLWVVTTDRRGHGVAIVHDAATPQQTVRLKKDSRASHFMWRTLGIAFGDNGAFGTAQCGWPGSGDANYMFMGPTLWSADTAIFASKYQESNEFLASHLDMLHQSPWGLGIAHERDNIFWVTDARYNDVTRYDFRDPHEVGGTDHRDGVIRRYSQVVLTPVDRTHPAHLAYDVQTSWLYVVDPGAKRIIRLDTRTGSPVENLTPPDESMELLAEFARMDDAVIETVIDTGLVDPVGIDVKGGRLIVGDRATGRIRMYDLSSGTPVFMGSIATGATDLLGVTIGPDDHIWCVDRAANTVLRLQTAANVVMRPLERVVLAGTTMPRTTAVRLSHDGTGDRTFRLRLRGTTPDGWNVSLAASEVVVGAGGTRDVEITMQADTGKGPITIDIEALEVGVNGAAVLRAGFDAVPDDLRRVIVDDGTTESFNIVDAVARTDRKGYIGVTSDAFLRVADSLSSLETVMWFSGSFGEISMADEAMLTSLVARDVDCFVVADDPFALRNEEPGSTQFFAAFGAQFQGVDVPSDQDNGRRLFEGVGDDPVTDGISMLDCQLPRLEHHRGGRYVPNVRFRTANSNARVMLRNRDNGAIGAVRLQSNDAQLRTIILGINPTRILDETLRTTLLDKGLEWLEGAAPVLTSVHDEGKVDPILSLAGQNPFVQQTAVRITGADVADVALYGIGGQRMIDLGRGPLVDGSTVTIDGSSLPSGTYFVIARSSSGISHLKLVKH
jgi:peroxiredoxin